MATEHKENRTAAFCCRFYHLAKKCICDDKTPKNDLYDNFPNKHSCSNQRKHSRGHCLQQVKLSSPRFLFTDWIVKRSWGGLEMLGYFQFKFSIYISLPLKSEIILQGLLVQNKWVSGPYLEQTVVVRVKHRLLPCSLFVFKPSRCSNG